jgi:hypothetical protein
MKTEIQMELHTDDLAPASDVQKERKIGRSEIGRSEIGRSEIGHLEIGRSENGWHTHCAL